MTTAHDVICEKEKMREKDVVGIVTFDLIGLLLTNHIIAYITLFHNKSKARSDWSISHYHLPLGVRQENELTP